MKLLSVALSIFLCANLAPAQTADEEWREKALEAYPDIGKKGSPLNAKFVALYRACPQTGKEVIARAGGRKRSGKGSEKRHPARNRSVMSLV